MAVYYRFYLENENTPFEERRFALGKCPPVPRQGENIALGDVVWRVLDAPTHYLGRSEYEVGFIVREVHLVEEEEAEATEEEEATAENPPKPGNAPLDAQGNCAYCGDSECPGGEDCNFYDGTLG